MSEEKESSLLEFLKSENPESITKWLKEFEKYERILDRLERLIDKIDRSQIANAFIRGMSKKLGTDLTSNPLGINAASPVHAVLFAEFNKMPTEQLQSFMAQIMTQQAPPKKKQKQ
ncbi:MAG: hypothetical protein EFT35_07720 [Methanophagales archaeon ANME-1-THS]|nr:MAG: hypothetical protein EFT35_07720 [Methanophagales archaeon ANME-1-THS]